MKRLILWSLAILVFAASASAQTNVDLLKKNKEFTGAKSTQKQYHAIYQLDENDPKTIVKCLRNISNALTDPRLAGKVKIELVAYSGGTAALLKGSPYEADLKALVEKGVIVAQCHNSLVEQKISPDKLYDFIAIVPSGNGELILRQAEGWAIVKP